MLFHRPLGALVLLLAAIPCAGAETVFVIDKLLVGVHQDQDLNSAIIKVLPTGTKLEVLTRKGELAKVKDPEGVSGWVDAAYLMDEPPAEAQLQQLQQDRQALADRLKALEANASTAADSNGQPPGGNPKVDALTNENTSLKSQLSAQKLKNAELEAELGELRKTAANAALGGGSVASELQTANLNLKRELEAAVEQNNALQARIGGDQPLTALVAGFNLLSTPVLIGLGLLLAAAFAAGAYLVDYLSRRRHGGFRV